jgi:hypothetical protein
MESFDKHLFHPSQIGNLMTESRTKEQWGETAKGYLLECWIEKTYGRRKDISNKYMEKGTLAEEDSIDLYSLAKKQYFEKNKDRIANEFFIGTPDLYTGKSITEADMVIDLKTSWDIFTFYSVMLKPINKLYYYQLQAYMDLTGAKEARLVYCLVNTPIHLVEDEKKKTMWKMGIIDPDTDEAYLEACRRIELNAYYDDIPEEDRYIDFIIERNDTDIERMHNRIIEARNFLNQLNNGTDYLRKH